MSAQPTDSEIMRRIRRQDQQALSELYTRYGGPVYSIAMRVLRNPSHSEEVTQDIFLRVWEKGEQWDPEKGKLSSWLLTMARHAAIDRLRKETRRPDISDAPLEDMPEIVSRIARVDTPQWQNGQLLREMLGELPDEQSQVIDMAFFSGFTHSQISEQLDLPLGTVKTRVRLGLQKLRSLWQEASDKWDAL